MAYNDDALEAIQDIKEAINTYGSTVTIVTLTTGAYDPYTGESTTRTEQSTKAIISSISTNENLSNLVDSYELSMKLAPTYTITKDILINYDGIDYEIAPNGIDKKVLQDTLIMYEILVKGSNN